MPMRPNLSFQETESKLLENTTAIPFNAKNEVLQGYLLEPSPEHGDARKPFVITLHGSLWEKRLITQLIPYGHHFNHLGLASASIEYPLPAESSPDWHPNDLLLSISAFLEALQGHPASQRIDFENIILLGVAAGTYPLLSQQLQESKWLKNVRAIICMSSLCDTTPKTGWGASYFPSLKEAKKVSPLHSISKGRPPLLMLHATEDRLLSFETAEKFAKLYRRKKNKVTFVDFHGVGHTFFNYNSNREHYEMSLRCINQFLFEQGFISNAVLDTY